LYKHYDLIISIKVQVIEGITVFVLISAHINFAAPRVKYNFARINFGASQIKEDLVRINFGIQEKIS